MNIFNDPDAREIAHNHVREVLELEEDEAEKVLESYRKIVKDLRIKLAKVKRWPADKNLGTGSERYTAQKIRGTLLQLESVLAEVSKGLKVGMREGGSKATQKGLDHLVKEIEIYSDKFRGAVNPINLNRVLIAQESENYLMNNYEVTMDRWGKRLLAKIEVRLAESIAKQESTEEVMNYLRGGFIGMDWQLRRIVRTELHTIYSQGKQRGMQDIRDQNIVPDLKKTLFHPDDSHLPKGLRRTGDDSLYAKSLNLIVNIEEPFSYKWRGKERIFMTPPDRPNDRSILIPYSAAWG